MPKAFLIPLITHDERRLTKSLKKSARIRREDTKKRVDYWSGILRVRLPSANKLQSHLQSHRTCLESSTWNKALNLEGVVFLSLDRESQIYALS